MEQFRQFKAAGVVRVIVKLGGSNDGGGLYAETVHQDNARAAGLLVEHYWANGTQGGPARTSAFIKATGQVREGERFWWDVEHWSNPSGRIWTPDEVIEHRDALTAEGITDQGIYLNLSLANNGGYRRTDLPLWLAAYTDAPTVLVRGGWRRPVYWQFTSDGIPATRAVYDADLDVNRPGEHVWDVWGLQGALGITADGIYGPATTRAVRDFQARHGLVVDGDAGPKTLALLPEVA